MEAIVSFNGKGSKAVSKALFLYQDDPRVGSMYVSYISAFRTGSFGISACMLAGLSEFARIVS